MKKIVILLALLALSVGTFSCGGGGAGSADVPSGENPGLPSVVQLLPSHYLAQTNAIITLHTKVLDGNGIPMPNIPVIFTNLSPIGVLSSTSANTDASGLATVTLKSTTEGFATVQAEVNTGAGRVRDRKTVYFSSYAVQFIPYLILEVDGDNDGNYGEATDLNLFESPSDTQVTIRATHYNRFGQVVANSTVTFGADWPYRVGSETTCSDGGTSCEVWFPLGNTATTDEYGQAYILVQVDPIILRSITTVLNITAYCACDGATGMVSLFLQPVTVSTVTLSANPAVVEPEGTSAITAAVLLNSGGPAPDGTTVSFTTTCGSVTPFAQTTDGVAEADFTAPATPGTCTITGRVGTVSGTTTVTVTRELMILPPSVTVLSSALAQTVSFTISGGTPPYTTTSSDPSKAYDSAVGDGIWTGASITVNIPANVCPGDVTLNVNDSVGGTTSATLTIITSLILVAPPSASICEDAPGCAGGLSDNQTFTITGGASPYSVASGNAIVISNPVVLPGPPATFNVNANNGTVPVATTVAVTLTVTDVCGTPKDVIVSVVGQ